MEALKQALAEPGEHRLFRSGKLAGLFPGRSGANAEAAVQALRDGLLEVVRTETKGKTNIEWVRLTPRGVDFLHAHESPAAALKDLHLALHTAREAVPAWQAEMKQNLATLGERLAEDSQRLVQRLDALSRRVEEALRRLEEEKPHVSDEIAAAVPWALDALAHLDRRRQGGAAECPLPELFSALSGPNGELRITAFHEGLRRLREARLLKLLPWAGNAALPQPEFAMLDNGAMVYSAAR
jgi:hypothetical protein